MKPGHPIGPFRPARPLAGCISALFLAIVIGGCAPAASSVLPTPTAAPPATPTAAPTPSPSVSSVAVMTLCATDQQPCPIDAGTYSTAPFEPAFTFTVGDGWSSDRVFADGGQLSKGEAAFVWASGVKAGLVDGAEVVIGPTIADFIAHLERYKGFELSEPTETTVGGLSATQIDVTTKETNARGIYFVKEDRMNLAPGEKARFFLIDKDGATVILLLDAYHEAGFDAFTAETGSLLESLAWE